MCCVTDFSHTCACCYFLKSKQKQQQIMHVVIAMCKKLRLPDPHKSKLRVKSMAFNGSKRSSSSTSARMRGPGISPSVPVRQHKQVKCMFVPSKSYAPLDMVETWYSSPLGVQETPSTAAFTALIHAGNWSMRKQDPTSMFWETRSKSIRMFHDIRKHVTLTCWFGTRK